MPRSVLGDLGPKDRVLDLNVAVSLASTTQHNRVPWASFGVLGRLARGRLNVTTPIAPASAVGIHLPRDGRGSADHHNRLGQRLADCDTAVAGEHLFPVLLGTHEVQVSLGRGVGGRGPIGGLLVQVHRRTGELTGEALDRQDGGSTLESCLQGS